MEGKQGIPEQGVEAGKGKAPERQATEGTRRSLVIPRDGMPGLETDLEPHSMEEGKSTSRKRKRECNKEEEIRRLEDELELVRINMVELSMEIKVDGVPGENGALENV